MKAQLDFSRTARLRPPCRHLKAEARAAAALSILLLWASAAVHAEALDGQHWVVTWGASPAPQLSSDEAMASRRLIFQNQTLREIVHTSLGGRQFRVRLSNVFGADEVLIGAASMQGQDGSSHPLAFAGQASVTLPANAEMVSDPIDINVAAGADVAINLYLPGSAKGAAVHYVAWQNSYLQPGDHTSEQTWPHGGSKVGYWAFLEGLDVNAKASARAIVAFGDSITDGAHSTVNENRRWPDILAARLRDSGFSDEIGVVNAGIRGNRILHDGNPRMEFGVSALARLDRDALAQPGARYLVVLEGINDIGHVGKSQAVTAKDLIEGLSQIAERAHEVGLKVYAATLTPFEGVAGGYYTSEKNSLREQYNDWIRHSPLLDGVIDFDRVTRDPANPLRLRPAYDCGDHLHPNDSGYLAMGKAVPLAFFR